MKISPFIHEIYDESSIKTIEVPNMSVKERVEFIMNNIQ
jgi:predicted ATPase